MSENLDVHAGHHTPVLTEELIHLLDSKALWTDYRIDDDIVVSAIAIQPVFCSFADLMTAFYIGLPTCRHLRDDIP